MKKIARRIVVSVLARQLKQLRAKHTIKVVAVVGSIGKTSTKYAIAATLSQKYRVRFQEGNYNDLVTVPLVFFGTELPSLFNPLAWLKTFSQNKKQIEGDYPYDVVVVELGTDGPGQIAAFAKYLKVDVAVVTALTPEHMEFFADLNAVAFEELSVSGFSDLLIGNADLCAPTYRNDVPMTTYGIHQDAMYQVSQAVFSNRQYGFTVKKKGKAWLQATHPSISELQLYSLLAAAAVADVLAMLPGDIVAGFGKFKPVSGRMQLLQGIHETTIIDDTYNASPEAVKGALDTLYHIEAPQRIALLGNMNELGNFSEEAHKDVGSYCDPTKIDLLITLAGDANEFLAAEAEARGCRVIRTTSPYEAAEKINELVQPGAVILAKGSQNRVFAEEAVKALLANPNDAKKLVRQSGDWRKIKQQQFGR